jgi:transcriptional regulator with XRE-family HTH domain
LISVSLPQLKKNKRVQGKSLQSHILDFHGGVQYDGLMNLHGIGKIVAERRRARGLTLRALADEAHVGRSTLAALEAGKLAELGYGKVARICAAVDLVLEARPLALEKPLTRHRHLVEPAGRELTKAAIEDIILRGDLDAWRGLVRALQRDASGRLARRARDVLAGSDRSDSRVHAFSTLLSGAMKGRRIAAAHA